MASQWFRARRLLSSVSFAAVSATGAGSTYSVLTASSSTDDRSKSRTCLIGGRLASIRRPPIGPSGAFSTTPLSCEQQGAPRLRYGTCKLRDGRLLSYHEEGSGTPVFAFHGMGSSRLTWLNEQSLTDLCPGVRLIAVDRPGYGGSSPPPYGYSYSAFARDIEELADALDIPRFCVAGHSSGGPYALAAAAEMPDRVLAAAAISSDAPYVHPSTPRALRDADSFSEPAVVSSIGLYGREPAALAEDMRSSALKKGSPAKVHAWKQGTDGWVCDFTLERIPYSFQLESITLGPRMTIWVGGEDIDAIAIGAPFLQQLIPGSQLRVVPGGDHGFKSQPEHLKAILDELKLQCAAYGM
eukprot:TRINITY_DN20587_c0_g1_i1.p1 TRINITY_DN20587_c0_g1~~TRINITY_DN20587_c0_g1_i1.p1  ORF type:complete len:371 (+),score=29.21 TRINITY_DN20587_c0_g1_i1:51-1115(+)